MAVFKFINEEYEYQSDMWRVIRYCREKACFIYSSNTLVYSNNIIYYQFLHYKRYYFKEEGDLLLHFVLSFDSRCWERWVSVQIAEQCAMHICGLFEGFQSVALLYFSYYNEEGKFCLGCHDEDSLYMNSPFYNNGFYKVK